MYIDKHKNTALTVFPWTHAALEVILAFYFILDFFLKKRTFDGLFLDTRGLEVILAFLKIALGIRK